MTTSDQSDRAEHRVDHTFELDATPEQVWDAIATSRGVSAWMVPTELDPRVGGEVSFDFGHFRSVGVVTGYEPHRRFAYEEPWPMTDDMREWAASLESPPSESDLEAVGPIATEFIIESASGGSCVLRVVTSSYGRGADWENEYFTQMAADWKPLLDKLAAQLSGAPLPSAG